MKIVLGVVFPLAASLASMFFTASSARPASSNINCISSELSRSLTQLARANPTSESYEKLSTLAIKLKELGINCISQHDMDTLLRMLRDDGDTMRFFAAMIIANVGPNAREAIPALEAALAERPCEDKTVTSAHAIRIALRRLGENPPPSTC